MPKESTKVSKKQETEVEQTSPDDHFVHIKDLDVDKITLPAIDDKRSSDSRYHIFPTYQYGKQQDKIVFVTDEIKITKGGIPKLDDKWRKNDSKREFFWLGWDKEQENSNALFEKLKEIDEKFDDLISYDSDTKQDKNVETQTVHLLKDKTKKEPLNVLEYAPLVRMSVQGGDGEQKVDQPEYNPYERIKVKFQKKWDKNKKEGDLSELTTVLFIGDKEEEEDLTYPSDFEKYLRWNCTARFVCQITKFGCKKTIEKDKKGKQVPRDCGFDLTVLQVVITKEAPTSGASTADKYRKRMFPKLGSVPTHVTEKKNSKHESSDESSEESGSEEDQKPTKNTAKNTTKNTKKSVKSESEEEDEPSPPASPAPPAPPAPPSKSKSAKKESKDPVKKQTKKVDSESSSSSEASDSEDSNDSSSEEKPKPSKKSSR